MPLSNCITASTHLITVILEGGVAVDSGSTKADRALSSTPLALERSSTALLSICLSMWANLADSTFERLLDAELPLVASSPA